MNEAFILILESMIVAMINFFVFSLIFKDDFDLRFNRYQGRVKNLMAQESNRLVETMKPIIELDPDAVERIGFGDKWRSMIEALNKVKKDKLSFEALIKKVYYPVIGSVAVSASDLIFPYGISLPFGYSIYMTSIGWFLLSCSLILLVRLVVLYRSLEKKISELPEFVEENIVDEHPDDPMVLDEFDRAPLMEQS